MLVPNQRPVPCPESAGRTKRNAASLAHAAESCLQQRQVGNPLACDSWQTVSIAGRLFVAGDGDGRSQQSGLENFPEQPVSLISSCLRRMSIITSDWSSPVAFVRGSAFAFGPASDETRSRSSSEIFHGKFSPFTRNAFAVSTSGSM